MWPLHPTAGKNFPDLPLMEGTRVINPKLGDDEQNQLTTQYTERAVRFIEKNKDRPFFLYVHLDTAHVPYNPPQRLLARVLAGPGAKRHHEASARGYGTFTMTAAGVWTYTIDNTNSAVQALNVGDTLVDTFTVTTLDGTPQVVTITISGTNDVPVIGGVSTGGFLKAANDALTSLEDSTNGIIKNEINGVQKQISDQDTRIADEQTRIDLLRTSLQERMAAADALIAQMEQQVTYFTNMFDTMKNSGYGQ